MSERTEVTSIEQARAAIEALKARKAELRAQRDEVVKELDQLWEQAIFLAHGIRTGYLVTGKDGKEFVVTGWSYRWDDYSLGKPTISGNYRNKNGEFSQQDRTLWPHEWSDPRKP